MNEIYAALLGAVITFLVTWGAMRSKVVDLERRADKADSEYHSLTKMVIATRETFANQIGGLSEVYVAYRHFNQAMQAIRESHQDLKEDMKKILSLLSER
jgi:hypothetical protein